MGSSSSGDWRRPLVELEVALQKLRVEAQLREGVAQYKLESTIAEYERRRDNYIAVMEGRTTPST